MYSFMVSPLLSWFALRALRLESDTAEGVLPEVDGAADEVEGLALDGGDGEQEAVQVCDGTVVDDEVALVDGAG
jgi:hypothetical protein